MLDQRTFNVDTFCNESTHDEIKEIVYKKRLKVWYFSSPGRGGVWVDLGIFLADDTFRKMSSVLRICFAIYWSHFRQKWPFVQPAQ